MAKARSANDRIEDRLAFAKVAIDNALSNPDILSRLEQFNYSTEKLEEGQALYVTARTLQDQQQQNSGDAVGKTGDAQNKLGEARAEYMRLVKLARIQFAKNIGAISKLELEGNRARRHVDLLAQARRFYAAVLSDETLVSGLSSCGVTRESLEAGQALVTAAETVSQEAAQFSARAQAGTDTRNQALAALKAWMRPTCQILKLALADSPQLLEAVGYQVT